MEKVLVLFFLVTAALFGRSQNLVGLWQKGTPEVSAGYHNVYQFDSDGNFKFKTDEYFGLKRIISINGTYKIVKNVLTLTVVSTTEIVGGSLERSQTSGEATDSWQIIGGEIKVIPLQKSLTENITIEAKKSDIADAELVLFDKNKYYRIN